MPGDRERCLASGANEYMSKPVNFKALAALVTRMLAAPEGGK
jgi:CheY-like chemotaxis protein